MPETPTVTDTMRRNLATLERCGWIGATRGRGAWRGVGGTIALADAPALTTTKLARVDYRGRAPRLRLTAAGARILAGKQNPSDAEMER